MTLFWCLVLSSVAIIFVRGDTVDSKTTRKFQFSIMQQNLQSIIMSIEERLRNLDTIYSSRSSTGVEGTLEQFSRKLDKMESKLSQIESIVQLQMEKLSENMNAQFLKEDINREHIKRKLDVIHENVNNRLTYNEIKLDTIGRSAYENNNFIRSKLQKFEDRVTSRISEVEVGISDSIVSLEDVKDVCAFTRNNTNDNLSDAAEKVVLDYFAIIENKYNIGHKQIVDNIQLAESNIKSSLNKSYEIITDVEDNFNEFSNKLSEIGDAIYDKAINIERSTSGLGKSINATRNEVQNGFRSLMVQMGKQEKSQMRKDSSEMLNEMDKKIENNFENVLLAQNIFLETCHRLQMDESQIENKIGDIFQKLLDTLDAKMLVEADDVKEINKVLKNLLPTKSKPLIKLFDYQFLYDLLKNMEQMQKQLLSMENGINKTIAISQASTENRNIIIKALADIREVIKSGFDNNTSILKKFLIFTTNMENTTTVEAREDIDKSIDCIFYGINCTKDIFELQIDNDSIVFEENNNMHNLIYDFNIRTLMNADNDNERPAEDSNIKSVGNAESNLKAINSFEKGIVDDTKIKELIPPQRIQSPINE